jgi:hypothetical protein
MAFFFTKIFWSRGVSCPLLLWPLPLNSTHESGHRASIAINSTISSEEERVLIEEKRERVPIGEEMERRE